MFSLNKRMANKISEQSKEYFALKLQEFDDLVDEKAKLLNQVDEEEMSKTLELNAVKEKIIVTSSSVEYEIDDIFDKMKYINNKMNFSNENIVNMFIKEVSHNADNDERHMEVTNLHKAIKDYGEYEIIIVDERLILKQLINQNTKYLSDELLNFLENIDYEILNNFLIHLENLLIEYDDTIYVEVGDEKASFDHLNKRIKTIYNERIYKGIKIRYKNKVYDYSLM